MDNLLNYLKESFLFLFGEANLDGLEYPSLIFLISTAFIGLLCILLDFAYYKTSNGKSLFNLSYIGFGGTLLMFTFWGIGSGIVGFLTTRLGLMATTIQASIVMGLGWPLLFPKLYTYAQSQINSTEPEESFVEETEEEPEQDVEVEEEDDEEDV